MLNKVYFRVTNSVRRMLWDEDGDTNFISILIILAVVLILAGVFFGIIRPIIANVKDSTSQFEIPQF